ncbi:MAG: TDP-N-acetylfucosamine:lipid II N-acetylfucosaminyltransferase [Bacteriovoracaceae bacterium]|nr:TDP-N-acetylfucosamine:lipid II N-acetylfucosaminyltransferase [Bacteriovoracaceae bacterium]
MILHIAPIEKFMPSYVAFIDTHFNSSDHYYIFWGYKKKFLPPKRKQTLVLIGSISYYLHFLKIFYWCFKAKKIILHGLSSNKFIRFFYFYKGFAKKCYWCIWGGELYSYKFTKKSLSFKLNEFFKRKAIQQFGNLVTYIKGDVELAQKWFGAKGKWHPCLGYTSNIYQPNNNHISKASNSNKTYIMIGNAASKMCKHLEVLDKIKQIENQNIHLFIPLSYGDQKYAKEVQAYAIQLFGSNCVDCLLDFLPLNEYLDKISMIDIAIFAHERQQGMGNIINLLGMGKKVYIDDSITSWDHLKSLNLDVYSWHKFDLNKLTEYQAKRNSEIIQEFFTAQVLMKQWKGIFLHDPLQ